MFLAADYSQIELRVLAHFSGDATLIEAFRAGEDIHARTASLIFNLMPQFITPDMRAQAKTVNFGVIYGQTPFGLSRQLGIPLTRARQFIDHYFEIYGQVRQFTARVRIDTPVELEYYRNGGIMPYVLRQLIAS